MELGPSLCPTLPSWMITRLATMSSSHSRSKAPGDRPSKKHTLRERTRVDFARLDAAQQGWRRRCRVESFERPKRQSRRVGGVLQWTPVRGERTRGSQHERTDARCAAGGVWLPTWFLRRRTPRYRAKPEKLSLQGRTHPKNGFSEDVRRDLRRLY